MPRVTTIKTVLLRPMLCTWWSKGVGTPVWLITQPVLDDGVVFLRCLACCHVTSANVAVGLVRVALATFKPVA